MKANTLILVIILSLFATKVAGQCTASISGGTSPVCINTSPGTFTATGGGGTSYTYLWYLNGVATSTTTQTYDPGNLAATSTIYCAITCDGTSTENSSTITITVNPATIAGSVTGGSAVCSGSNSGILTLSGYTGTIVRWESSPDGSSWSPITHTSDTYTSGALTATRHFRAVVQSGVCTAENSGSTIVTVDPASDGGTINSAQSICDNTVPAPLTLISYTGSIVRWERSGSASFSSPVTIAVTTPTLTLLAHTSDTWYRAVVQSGSCPADYSDDIKINVYGTFYATISGGSTSICYNTSPGTFTATGNGGGGTYSYQWYSTSSGLITGATNAAYNPGSITASNGYYCLVSTADCGSSATPTANVTVLPQPTLTGAVQASIVCSGSAGIINLSGLLAGSTSSIAYSIDGVAKTPVPNVVANGSGAASFTTVEMIPAYNGKILQVTGVTTTSTTPNCFVPFAANTALIVNTATVPAITGNLSPCINSTIVYSTEPGMTNYLWTISGILGTDYTRTLGGTGDNTVSITWLTSGLRTVSVNYTNSNNCSVASPTVKNITVNPLPSPSIASGPGSVCIGSTGNVYTTQAGMPVYSWAVSAGGSITSGGSGNFIVVTWNTSGPQSVSVNYTSASGCTALSPTVFPVTVNPLPVPALSGPLTVRAGSTGNVYTTDLLMSNYVWTVSPGGTVTAGGTPASNTVTVTWNTAVAQSVSVRYTSASNCSAASATANSVTVNPLPSVSNVQISGTPAIGYTLTGSYNYNDGGSGSNISTFRWLRNGTTPIAGALSVSYVVQASDLNSTITFEVTPVTSAGTPNSGTVVASAATVPVENLSEVPVADEVCIEGIRSAGSILKGKYRYIHSKPEGASTYKWFINGVQIPSATGTQYTLLAGDIDNNEDITFGVTPISSNIIPVPGTPAISDPLARIPLLPAEYSVAVSSVPLVASPSGGVFSGPGVTNGIFSPSSVGIPGSPYTIQYLLTYVNSTTTCSQKVTKTVSVVENTTDFGSFKPVYCNDEGTDEIIITGIPAGAISLGFTLTDADAIVSSTPWTVIIDPKKMNQGNNKDILYFKYRDLLGYEYEISKSFVIDAVGTKIQILNLLAEYCADAPKTEITVTGATPAGGTGEWTGTILTDLSATSASVDVALGIPYQTYPVTYQYTTPLGCKSAVIPRSVTINPLPDPSFLLNPFYNVDGGEVLLVPVQSPGTFSDYSPDEVVLGDKLFPDRAGLGEHTINYYIKDGKGCDANMDRKTIIKKAQGTFNDIPSVICYRDTTFIVRVTGLPAGMSVTGFVNTKNSIIHIPGSTTAEYNVPAAGAGIDVLTFSYKLDGVDYWLSKEIDIDQIPQILITGIQAGEKICDNDPLIPLEASLKGGIFSGPVIGNNIDPSKAAGDTSITYKYTIIKKGYTCSTLTTVPFTIAPSPQVSFVPKDACIETPGKDYTYFLNNTVSTDSVSSWIWTFKEEDEIDKRKEPEFLYQTGGLHTVSLYAKTVNGCDVTKTSTIDLGIRPKADFYWKNDCYAPGGILKLFDATKSDFPVLSRTWTFNNVATSSDLNPEYPMPDEQLVKVKYIVRTRYSSCADTLLKDVRLRPTISIAKDGFYREDFEKGKGGWGLDDSDTSGTWKFGTPDRSVIKSAASGDSAWFTGYDQQTQNSDSSSIISQCFDFTGITRPMIALKTFKRFDNNRNGAALQYKTDDNNSWKLVGTFDDGIDWYNSTLINGEPGRQKVGWTTIDAPDDKWMDSRHDLDPLAGRKNIKFRIAYGADNAYGDGIAIDDIRIGERNRKVLFEHFTNTGSQSGNEANSLVDEIMEGREKDVINIQYHTNFPGSDPFFSSNPGDASARIFSYGLSRVPYSLIDGGYNHEVFASLSDFKSSKPDTNDLSRRSLMDSLFTISVTPVISGGVLTINSSVTAVEGFTSDNMVLYLVVTEKKNNSQTGPLKDKVFLNVFRKFIPDAGGIELRRTWSKGESVPVPAQTWIIENITDFSDIEVIAFIQNSQTKEVYQAESEVLTTGKSATDKSTQDKNAIGPEDKSLSATITFGLYPNPAEGRLTIEFSSPLETDADIRIYDLQGAVKSTLKVASGESSLIIDDLGLRAGIYLVRITAGGTDLGFRKLIVSGD